MQDNKDIRLNKIAKELNVGINTIVEFLHKKGQKIDANPNTKIDGAQYDMLVKEFSSDMLAKKQVEKQVEIDKKRKETITAGREPNKHQNNSQTEKQEFKILGKIDLDQNNKTKTTNPQQQQKTADDNKQKLPVQHDNNKKPDTQNGQQRNENKNKNNNNNNNNKPKNSGQQKDERSIKVVGKVDLDSLNRPAEKRNSDRRDQQQERGERSFDRLSNDAVPKDDEVFVPKVHKITGPTIVGKIELHDEPKPSQGRRQNKKKRRRIGKEPVDIQQKDEQRENSKGESKNRPPRNGKKGEQKEQKERGERGERGERNENKNNGESRRGRDKKHRNEEIKKEITAEDIKKQIKETRALMENQGGKSATSKYNRLKRKIIHERIDEENKRAEDEKRILEITEFITANDLSSLMDVPVNQLLSICFDLGTPVSINSRLDAEMIKILAEEFGFEVKFLNIGDESDLEKKLDPNEMEERPPIVTIMGHVDHGKTALLDYIRKTNVIAGEAGGITQHIGAYNVSLPDGKRITFLDTPGHEAFTAMRARGTKITDIVVIVIAADSQVMPTTEEAISHAKAANVPIIFAINKIDRPNADPEKIRRELSERGMLVEDWGGDYGCVDISAKQGTNVDKLLERILLEAEVLELKASYTCPAFGSVVEASLDHGQGYVTNVVVSHGILKVGDVVWAGCYSGKIKAMFNERNKRIKSAGPAMAASILGLNGAPNAGDKFEVMEDERAARERAVRRQQIEREITNRINVMDLNKFAHDVIAGNSEELVLNLVIKGDVQGSIEALKSSFEKLSTESIKVKVIHAGVGQISESDVMLAKASKAIIIGFQVRPAQGTKKLAEKDNVEIRLYSIIYDAIDDVKDALEGMLSPDIKEEITGTAEIKEIFKISKVGNIAGCLVQDGKIIRKNKCRVIRDGIVVYSGELGSLKRFKDDVSEVTTGMECGLNIDKFNDIRVGDIIESYDEKEVRKKL